MNDKNGYDYKLVHDGFLCLKHAPMIAKSCIPQEENEIAQRDPSPYSKWVDGFLDGDYANAPIEVQQLWIVCMLYLAPRATSRVKVKSECGDLRVCTADMVRSSFTVSDEAMIHLIMKYKAPGIVTWLDGEDTKIDEEFKPRDDEEPPEGYELAKEKMNRKAGRKKADPSELGAKQDEFEAIEKKIMRARRAKNDEDHHEEDDDSEDDSSWSIGWYEAIAAAVDAKWATQTTTVAVTITREKPVSKTKKIVSRNGQKRFAFGDSLHKNLGKRMTTPMPPLTGQKRQRTAVATPSPPPR